VLAGEFALIPAPPIIAQTSFSRYDSFMSLPKFTKISFVGFIFVLFCAFPLFAGDPEQADEPGAAIIKYTNKFSLSLTNNYNFIDYFQNQNTNDDFSYIDKDTNKDTTKGLFSYDIGALGIGLAFKNSLLNFGFTIPLNSQSSNGKIKSMNFDFKHCGDKFFTEARVNYYNNFYNDGDSVDMDILNASLSSIYVFNWRHHSLGAAYQLNAYQTQSSGSLLAGADILFSYMSSEDLSVTNKHKTFSAGPSMGYSYTWVFPNKWFINAFILGTAAIGANYDTSSFCFTPGVKGKIAAGFNRKTWSMNFVLESNFNFYMKDRKNYDSLETANIGFTVSKRFF
jgi:hypothetical protein